MLTTGTPSRLERGRIAVRGCIGVGVRYALRRDILFFSCGFFGAFRDAFDEVDEPLAIRLWPNRGNQLLVMA
jgi:hypothetical protein